MSPLVVAALVASTVAAAVFAVAVGLTSRSAPMRRLRLVGNIALLLVLFVPLLIGLGLVAYALWNDQMSFALIGLLVAGGGVAVFESASIRFRSAGDWLSTRPHHRRVKRIWEDTRALWRGEGSPDD